MTLIAAAAIVDNLKNPGWLLCAQRSAPEQCRGKWELPGGHVEPGETPEAAIRRELAEELGINVAVGQQVKAGPEVVGASPEGDWPITKGRVMRVWLAEIIDGTPVMLEDHMALEWRAFDDLDTLSWLGQDRPIIDAVIEQAGWHSFSW